MTRKRDPEEVAAERLQLITPLLDPLLDHAALVKRKKKICEEADWQISGLDAGHPAPRRWVRDQFLKKKTDMKIAAPGSSPEAAI